MDRDRLFLLSPDFEDPAYPGKRFYCWHCALLEGVLAAFPKLASRLDVERVPFPRPRAKVVAAAGEANQSLPLLVLAGEGQRLVKGKDAILAALTERHGFPEPHPQSTQPTA
jgi:hypothetical protein